PGYPLPGNPLLPICNESVQRVKRSTAPGDPIPPVQYATAEILRRSRGKRGREAASRVFAEQSDAGRVAVQEVVPAHRADFAHGEEAADRDPPQFFTHGGDVVVGSAEEPLATSIAAEQERADGIAGVGVFAFAGQQRPQIFTGGGAVPDLE